MKPALEPSLKILADSLHVAYRRCRQAAGAAEPVDDALCEQLLHMSAGIQSMIFGLEESIEELDDFNHIQAAQRDRTAAADDYHQGPQ